VFLSNVVGLPRAEGWLPYAESGSPFFANLAVLLATALVIVEAHVLARREARTSAPAIDDDETTPALAA
jgi:hypothetical protein